MDSEVQLNDIYTLVFGTSAMLLMVMAIISFAFLFQRKLLKKQQAYREIEKMLQKEELKSAYALIEGQEQERKRIAVDLHDNLGSLLATLKIYSDLLRIKDHEDAEQKSLADKIALLAEQATDETRRVSHNLDSGILSHFGLKTAVTQVCEAVEKSKSMKVMQTLDVNPDLPGDITLHVYRIIQELFTNTLKHAHASTIRLELTQINNDYISLIFEDNGQGFTTTSATPGMGLQNIRSRIERLQGTLTIDSNATIGTHIIIEIPIRYGTT